MLNLEQIMVGARVLGLAGPEAVEITHVHWYGTTAVEVGYRDGAGVPREQLLYREQEEHLALAVGPSRRRFAADGRLFRLVSEAHRIRLAYLFDPLLAVHTSIIDPLPHQIEAVYGEMVDRQPLRFLLADDPGAGKTIMTGLLIKELAARGAVERALVVAPGALVEQWQDELWQRFQLRFEIFSNEAGEAAVTGNWFREHPRAIARLDKLSRDELAQRRATDVDWDLVVVDEAHKMAATYTGGEVKYTQRFQLGRRLSGATRHLLLLTATPHNGKEADFQLFLSLLDPDRFEGKPRGETAPIDPSGLMRRMVKEKLVTFENKPLFPERRAYTVNYALSPGERELYQAVTAYVAQEFSRADQLGGSQRGRVGFALTMLQRRLASSPEAIYQSLSRRRQRLEARLTAAEPVVAGLSRAWDEDSADDLEDSEAEADAVADEASAARTRAELLGEIGRLGQLEAMALALRQSHQDRKWDELCRLLESEGLMQDRAGARRKLVVFTEHRDTLNYLQERIANTLGQPDAVVAIHGGLSREQRRAVQARFTQDPACAVLVATDAAGEGINLQRAHLMINYDLPWNPNRLEQRFGRIHRIGQTEVCHLWNLVAAETREGAVFLLLLRKMEQQREALGGQVYDVLGQVLFDHRPLRDLLVEAVRYGDRPDVRERLAQTIESAWDARAIQALMSRGMLVPDALDPRLVYQLADDMARAEARRLQPHYIADFFLTAFRELGGAVHAREAGRWEVTHVPPALVREGGGAVPVLRRYERITFQRDLITLPGRPVADLLCPGHPLLDAVVDLTLERHRALLGEGSVLVDRTDPGETPRVLVYLEHAIADGRPGGEGASVVSRRLEFVELFADSSCRAAGYAPYLDYTPLAPELADAAGRALAVDSFAQLENAARAYAVEYLVPAHLREVADRRLPWVEKTRQAVHQRLTAELVYWDQRAAEFRRQAEKGQLNAALNAEQASRRHRELADRLARRMTALEAERHLQARPPVAVAMAVVVPQGWVDRQSGVAPVLSADVLSRARVEQAAMDAVMEAERGLGHMPQDVSAAKVGYDIESRDGTTGRLRLIEVKGRAADADTVTVTKNEILTALNQPRDYILAVVRVGTEGPAAPVYIREPFQQEPDFAAASVNFDLHQLIKKGANPT